ncbi:ubiquitin family protein [Cucumis melo var. makuwa]|uniref:Ubiquitin family protein n=1 Tax=Cucumis melo var. makuwa TaxID=1194695 RepID=A0A5D3CHX8_CUCMM|nr:ubiquitin family protein [Cucumis melo var. makuwa]TYK11513.1 ubiquitin family protein [Cucumis melo var. makuwa]
MAEIVEDSNFNRNISNRNPPQDTVEVIVRTIGPTRPSRLLTPSTIKVQKPFFFVVFQINRLKVCDLRKLVAESSRLPIGNLKLILRGKILDDCKNEDDVYVRLNHGDSLTVAVKPKPPAEHLRDEFDEDEDDLKFRLPESSSRLKKKVYTFLREKLKFPDILLVVVFSLSLKGWAAILLWFIMAPVAHSWDLGPLYILGTGFCIILLNLGHRRSGEMSAYSIFNEGFRELPGTLNADRLDRDVRLEYGRWQTKVLPLTAGMEE